MGRNGVVVYSRSEWSFVDGFSRTIETRRRGEYVTKIEVGRKIPDFELPDQQGFPWSLSGQLETGPVMLVFYRGDW